MSESLDMAGTLSLLQGWVGSAVRVGVGASASDRPDEWGDPAEVAHFEGELLRGTAMEESEHPYAGRAYSFGVGTHRQAFALYDEAWTGAHLLIEGVLAVMLDGVRVLIVKLAPEL